MPVFIILSLKNALLAMLPSSSQPPDHVLLQQIGNRDELAFNQFYDRYRRLVYSLLLRILGDVGAAEDALIDVFCRVWNQAGDYRPQVSSAKTWLFSIARHRGIDQLRRRKSHPDQNLCLWDDDALTGLDDGRDMELEIQQRDMRRKICLALRELPLEQRQALALAYFKGYSHSQIATALQQPLGTVKTRIRLALRHLQENFSLPR